MLLFGQRPRSKPVSAPSDLRDVAHPRLKGHTPPMAEKVQGPRSYFPSIEKKYGQPIDFWMQQLDGVRDAKHMEQVAFLKSEHGMGHGHANAIVAVYRAEQGI